MHERHYYYKQDFFLRFGGVASAPRKTSIYERPSTYKPVSSSSSSSSAAATKPGTSYGAGGARYRSSTLERSKNVGGGGDGANGGSVFGGSSTVGRKKSNLVLHHNPHQPFGATTAAAAAAPTSPTTSPTSTMPGLRRRSSITDLNGSLELNGALSNSSSNLNNLNGLDDIVVINGGGGSSKYKPASRSNSRNLFEIMGGGGLNGVGAHPHQVERESKYDAYSKRISETLARHGKQDGGSGSGGGSGILRIVEDGDGDSADDAEGFGSSSNSHRWRRRMEEEESRERREFAARQAVEVMSRSTSPQPCVDRGRRTRISRSTEPQELGHFLSSTSSRKGSSGAGRRGRPPRLVDSSAQTDPTAEFPLLTCTDRKVRPSASFDYYARVKRSLQEMPAEVSR